MGDLVWGRIFFPKPLVIELHTTPLYGRYFLARYFFPSKSVCRDIFSEITHTPLKSQGSAP